MMYFTRYDGTTGRILYTGNCTESEMDIHATHGPVLAAESDPVLDYVVLTGSPPFTAKRPVMELEIPVKTVPADGTSALVIGSVPAGTVVELKGPVQAQGTTTGEDVELVFSLAGIYTVTLTNFPYHTEKVTINAT